MTKVCIISPVHDTTDIRIFKKQALSLLNQGYQVSAICKQDSAGFAAIFDIKLQTLAYKSRLSRFISLPKILKLALKEKADIYHIHNPDTLPIGILLKVFRKKVIYDTHENFKKKILLRQWIPKALRAVIASSVFYTEKLFSYCFDATIVTQDEQLKTYHGTTLIGNSPLLPSDFFMDCVKPKSADIIKLVYVGGISEDRGLSNMLTLYSVLNSITTSELHLAGPAINSTSKEDIISKVEEHKNVFYHGVLMQKEAFKLIKQSDFGLILLNDVADYKNTSPNKLFEYMMQSTPFIASDFKKWKEVTHGVNAGFFISTNKIDNNFAQLLSKYKNSPKMYNTMSKEGSVFIKNHYNWQIVDEPKLLNLYTNIIG